MTGAAIALAFTSALCFGVALVLTHVGLRYIPPLPGAAISIPSSTLLFIMISRRAPDCLGGGADLRRSWTALPGDGDASHLRREPRAGTGDHGCPRQSCAPVRGW